MTHFDQYIRQGEPDKREKGFVWQTAIGLQQVDGLTPSDYLIETARQNIEGDISLSQARELIDGYYRAERVAPHRVEEADKVSVNIAQVLSEHTFSLSPVEYTSIHGRLFEGVFDFAGTVRDYNITKPEWALDGETVLYVSAPQIVATLEWELGRERDFSYAGLSQRQMAEHLARFVADLWQVHPFGEGNTRTSAVFLIKYLRKLGFTTIGNELFALHSRYFRNALVRANYENVAQGVQAEYVFLILFLENLLFGTQHTLSNSDTHI